MKKQCPECGGTGLADLSFDPAPRMCEACGGTGTVTIKEEKEPPKD